MNYTQVIQPDLNTVGLIGWCLAFVEKAFNDTNYSYATAHDGWQSCHVVHKDRNLPTDVCVPIWFDYYESGINYGHVAISVPGRGILSSPWRADNTQQWEPDIDTISRVYNSTYLGWSEDLMGVPVIKGDNDMVSKEAYLVGAQAIGTTYGDAFNYDPNISNDQFAQFLLGQAPRISKEMESAVADKLTGVKNVIGPDYNSPYVGKLVVTDYPHMVDFWADYAKNQPKGQYQQVTEPLYRKVN